MPFVDRFSKMAYIFHLHGIPVDLVSDRVSQFSSVFWQEFCRFHRATPSLSLGFHPQSNGQTKRLNQEMETALLCTMSQNPASWSQQLLWVEYAHNTQTSSATGLSPFQCAYRYQPPLFPALEEEASCPSVQAFLQRCRWTWTQGRA